MTTESHEVPRIAWLFAWSCLIGQVLTLAEKGRQEDNLLVPSMLLGAAIVAWVSYGVLRARMVRVVFVWIVFALASLAYVVGLIDSPSGWGFVDLVVAVVQFSTFVAFTQTPYFAWQRSRPTERGPSLSGLVAIAITVGALGGVVGADPDGARVEVTG